MVAVRLYLRYGLSYRDVEELLAERGIKVDQYVTAAQRWRSCGDQPACGDRLRRHPPDHALWSRGPWGR